MDRVALLPVRQVPAETPKADPPEKKGWGSQLKGTQRDPASHLVPMQKILVLEGDAGYGKGDKDA